MCLGASGAAHTCTSSVHLRTRPYDVRTVGPYHRFAGVGVGATFLQIGGLLGPGELHPVLSFHGALVLWITNAFNVIDGVEGLRSVPSQLVLSLA